ncbi:hypothetical protein KGM_207541 [Danaus plexippus plexippus]|uniref:Uncharacterized protein n=1 Tax=Danaus plexippus plexippus TaxID=278856 RepID=A0A212EZ28_DANPL|nr:hypothetical protein KGM_207541 [Danaus plexippus plexippus]
MDKSGIRCFKKRSERSLRTPSTEHHYEGSSSSSRLRRRESAGGRLRARNIPRAAALPGPVYKHPAPLSAALAVSLP